MINTNKKLINTSENSWLIDNQSYLPSLYKSFLDPLQYNALEMRLYENERLTLDSFQSFTDQELIYYYLHKPTYDDESKNKTEQTKKEYIRDILQFYSFIHFSISNEQIKNDLPPSYLKAIEKRHIRQYQEWLRNIKRTDGKIGYPSSTRTRKNIVIKGFLRWLHEEDIIDYPLHATFRKSTTRKQERPDRYLSLEEVQSLLSFYKQHPINHALLITLATTGLRVNEIATATWGDVYQDSSVKEGAYYLKVIGKGGVERHARLMEPTVKSILRFRKRRGLTCEVDPKNEEPLFTTNKGYSYSYKYLSNYIIKIIKRTKYVWLDHKVSNISPHWFRHFFVNYSVMELGLPIEQVQHTVGHSSRSTTEGYLNKYLHKKNDASLHWDEAIFDLHYKENSLNTKSPSI
ncbi:tyrosine-type recombinase/integrase (plasmid) [Alkalihalophilus pseudofirmus]|uniref:tyrosine-type recombinase/integrase n=1 Tax=Alkalihalophilus pseudofirmus TaxID=79885 RepID=UPI00259BAAC9|nr:tyrosine-type recombinase/integrase [Alkalihalophilus pseudofirmus]WEG19183.1 tyrosine-type recombinase/integrase [Alkalihalophilus pseudofirmus]